MGPTIAAAPTGVQQFRRQPETGAMTGHAMPLHDRAGNALAFTGHSRTQALRPPGSGLAEQALDQLQVQLGQGAQIVQPHMFVHLVDAGIDRPDLDALRAQRGDEARV